MKDNEKIVMDDRVAIPMEELERLLLIKAEYRTIIRIINSYPTYEDEECGKLLMKLYKVERKDQDE